MKTETSRKKQAICGLFAKTTTLLVGEMLGGRANSLSDCKGNDKYEA
jgi:hypothetical protein